MTYSRSYQLQRPQTSNLRTVRKSWRHTAKKSRLPRIWCSSCSINLRIKLKKSKGCRKNFRNRLTTLRASRKSRSNRVKTSRSHLLKSSNWSLTFSSQNQSWPQASSKHLKLQMLWKSLMLTRLNLRMNLPRLENNLWRRSNNRHLRAIKLWRNWTLSKRIMSRLRSKSSKVSSRQPQAKFKSFRSSWNKTAPLRKLSIVNSRSLISLRPRSLICRLSWTRSETSSRWCKLLPVTRRPMILRRNQRLRMLSKPSS